MTDTVTTFSGSIVALVTPFDQEGKIDWAAFDRLIDMQVEGGTSAVLVSGTTGEGSTISKSELQEMIERAVLRLEGELSLIVGAGTNSTEMTIERCKLAQSAGADALLVVAPYYNKPTQEGFYQHYEAVSAAVDLPVVVYNVPGRTGSNMQAETMARICMLPNVVAVKEASGNLAQIMHLCSLTGDGGVVLSGDDALTLSILAIGGKGVISVVANELPEKMAQMVSLALEGEYGEARRLHYEMLPLMEANFIESNPIPVKYALSKMGLITEKYRLPLVPMGSQARRRMDAALKHVGLI